MMVHSLLCVRLVLWVVIIKVIIKGKFLYKTVQNTLILFYKTEQTLPNLNLVSILQNNHSKIEAVSTTISSVFIGTASI